jgi:hypothetical protein
MTPMRRGKSTMTLSERLLKFAQETRRIARSLPPGKEREILLKKARQAEAVANLKHGFHRPFTADVTARSRKIQKSSVAGRTGGLFIVEDEYLLAHDLEQELRSALARARARGPEEMTNER